MSASVRVSQVGWGDCGRGRSEMYQYVLKEKGLGSSTAPKIDIFTVILIHHFTEIL